MNRRQFLRFTAAWGASAALGNMVYSCARAPQKKIDRTLLPGLRMIDAHAHPDQFYGARRSRIDETSTLKTIKEAWMAASSFSAAGDQEFLARGYGSGGEYESTKAQLERVRDLAKSGRVIPVLRASDVPRDTNPGYLPGAILAIEGGDPLEGDPDRVDEFYRLGVRMITLVHYRNNELGDIMMKARKTDPGPAHNGLTPAGRKVVERMQGLGMVVDVAHAHSKTLKQIADMTSRPLVDSHTSLCPWEDPSRCLRFRTWKEMEQVAKTGGVVCTWPIRYELGGASRRTFFDWAREILEMKKRLGMDHVGLGTDGGGKLPSLIQGYRDVRDLWSLIAALQEIGLSPEDIKSYMGGNFYRVLQKCIG